MLLFYKIKVPLSTFYSFEIIITTLIIKSNNKKFYCSYALDLNHTSEQFINTIVTYRSSNVHG